MFVSDLQQVNEVNINIVYMFAFLGVIAMILSGTGLFTPVSLNIIKRMKEIGVRKVLGASVSNIARIINTEFIVILFVASGIGAWAGYSTTDSIMGSIWHYYKAVNTATFAVSISLMFIISFIAIGYKVMSAATMNPVDSLKDE